jgi:hypothetical protein
MRRQGDIKLAVSIFMAIALALFLPGLGIAGSLEPTLDAADSSGNPVPTMKTLDQIPPTWSQKLQCDLVETIHGPRRVCPRFEVLADFNNEAVLDKETGLVWEKSPGTNIYEWQPAQHRCNNLCRYNTSGRCGWRLPTVQELESLIDPTRFSLQGVSTLPSGNPFSNVQVNQYTDTLYWSATVIPFGGSTSAWSVSFTSGKPPTSGDVVTNQNYVWCVRGGQGVDAQ